MAKERKSQGKLEIISNSLLPDKIITIDNILYQLEQAGGKLDKEEMKKYIFEYACRMCERKHINPAERIDLIQPLMKYKLEQMGNFILKMMRQKKCRGFELDLDEDCYKNLDDLVTADINQKPYSDTIIFHINLYK